MTPDRAGLDWYLRSVNERIQTTKMSSELWFHSPPSHQVQANDRFARSLISKAWPAPTAPGPHDPEAIWSAYQEAAARTRDVATHFGAAGHQTLNEYFAVDATRSGETALAGARSMITPSSPADHLLRTIDHLTAKTGATPARAAHQAMAMLSRQWPTPTPLTKTEARQLARLYMVGRYPYTTQEFRTAAHLTTNRRLRSALLAVQLQLTEQLRQPLSRLAIELGTTRALLPFTEAAVNQHGYDRTSPVALSPNPKLITVLCNNIVPAIAGELLRTNTHEDDLDQDVLRTGVIAARRRQVFRIMIALFNQADDPDKVTLSGFNMRVCPAATLFTRYVERWLPHHYDRAGSCRA